MVGGFRFFGGGGDIQFPHVFIKCCDVFAVDLLPVHACFIGSVDDLIVDIGEVADEINFVTGVLKITIKSVKDDGGAGVPDMAIVIDGDPAYVHADLVWF